MAKICITFFLKHISKPEVIFRTFAYVRNVNTFATITICVQPTHTIGLLFLFILISLIVEQGFICFRKTSSRRV